MTTSTTIRRSIALVAIVAAAAACAGGGDDGGGGDAEAADTEIGRALTAEFLSETDDSPISTEEQSRCLAGGIVSGIGEDRLAELGVTPDNVGNVEDVDFNADEVDKIVDAMFSCVDVKAALATEFEGDFGAEGAQCVADRFSDDMLRSMMASSFLGDESEEMSAEFFQEFLDIAAECDLPLD